VINLPIAFSKKTPRALIQFRRYMQLVRAESVSEVFLVPFLDLKAQYHSIKGEIDAAGIGKGEEKQGTVPASKLSDKGETDLNIPS
jgi:hypothetical protein